FFSSASRRWFVGPLPLRVITLIRDSRLCLHFDSPEYLSFWVLFFFCWWLVGAHR
ncbi:hypothetical protein S83_033316, partial [Arachis hypogaea]